MLFVLSFRSVSQHDQSLGKTQFKISSQTILFAVFFSFIAMKGSDVKWLIELVSCPYSLLLPQNANLNLLSFAIAFFSAADLSHVRSLLLHLIIIMLPITPAQLLLLNKCDQHYHWLATLGVTKRDERRFTITITVYSSLMDHNDAHTYVEELAGDWMMLINKIGTHFYIFKIAQLCSWFLHSSLVTGHQW